MTHTVTWRRLDVPGHEITRLVLGDDGAELGGAVALTHEGVLCALEYRVECDAAWQTTAVHVAGSVGTRIVDMEIEVARGGRWFVDGEEAPRVRGCVDIDLGFSPATNLLPIRRLALEVGDSAEVRAAWLPFPELTLEPLPQLYRRIDEHTYHYESNGGQFVRTLEVDETGMVTSYPGLWEAV